MAVNAFAQQKVKLNEPFWFGDYTYTFTGAKESKELVRSKHTKKNPDEGAGFFVVYYTVENMTNEPITGSDFKKLKVKDKNGRTDNANLFNTFYVGEHSVIRELAPGLPKKTAAVFEMPLSSFEGDASFTVIIPDNGDFKKETRELTFTKVTTAAAETNEAKSPSKPKAKSKTGT